jgi:hypothetical protein
VCRRPEGGKVEMKLDKPVAFSFVAVLMGKAHMHWINAAANTYTPCRCYCTVSSCRSRQNLPLP